MWLLCLYLSGKKKPCPINKALQSKSKKGGKKIMNSPTNLIVSPSPHVAKKHNSTRNIMLHVLIALLPVVAAAVYLFGFLSLINILFCVIFCGGFELLYNLIVSKKWNNQGIEESSIWNLSSSVTGVILALNLPTYIKIWGLNIVKEDVIIFSFDTIIACLIGSLVAIVVVKMLFGGIGKNFANPAAVGRIVLFLSFGMAISANAPWVQDGYIIAKGTGATFLSPSPDSSYIPSLLSMFFGNTGAAAVGETCVVAILVGYIYLSAMKIIDFRMPLILIASVYVFSLFFDGLIVNKLSGMALFENSLFQILSGGLIFAAVFMATDYSTSPNTFWGNVIFNVGIGLFTVMIRTWGSYPEGVSFAIVMMNIMVPLIDRFIRPRFFGEKGSSPKKAAALQGGK
jgi:electron transport complex protein RnfD